MEGDIQPQRLGRAGHTLLLVLSVIAHLFFFFFFKETLISSQNPRGPEWSLTPDIHILLTLELYQD